MTNLSQRSITYIDLVLKGKWYDLIESGEKRAEYRRLCVFWWTRIFSEPGASWSVRFLKVISPCNIQCNLKHHYVRFRRGYGKDAPTMLWYIGTTGYVCVPPADVQAEVGSDPVIKLELLQRIP